MPQPYILDQTWEGEAERLRGLEDWGDPTTIDHLVRFGVGPGWRCLEVGGGGGSIARWLAQRVRPGGQVTVVDLDTTLLEPLRDDGVEVLRADLLDHPLPGDFDLVHARLVLSHLQERRIDGLRRLVNALRPGGLLLIEEADFLWTDVGRWTCHPEEHTDLATRVWQAAIAVMKAGGFDAHWGRRLVCDVRDLGLDGVGGQGRYDISGGHGSLRRLSVQRFREPIVATGMVTHAEVDAYCATTEDPEVLSVSPVHVSVWGRRPC